ncbi:MAG: CBS domain-containing protein [Fusobacteriaceae bacterium]
MLTERQKKILKIIEENSPITGDSIGEILGVTRSALRIDFSFLINQGRIISKHRIGYILGQVTNKSQDKENLVGERMSLPLTLDEGVSIYEAIVFMFEKDIGTLYLTKRGFLSGVVSRKDLLKSILGGQELKKAPAYLIMTRYPKIICALENEKIIDVAKKIIKNEIDSLPVVREVKDDDGVHQQVLGRITKTNITKFFIDSF